ncbi:MAG: hypothetical protein R2748_34070 [Bryobacterales bacterium]
MLRRQTFIMIVAAALASSHFIPVIAADPDSGLKFTATFEPIRIFGRPGQVSVRNFRLTTAKGQRSAFFEAKTEDWLPSEDGKQSFYLEPGKVDRSCSRWVSLNPVESLVLPSEPLEVKISLSVPPEAEPGGYWCVLTLNERPDPTQRPQGVAVRFLTSISVGIFVYLDPVERSARIQDVQIHEDRAEVAVLNTGNSPLGVEGRVEFLSPDSQEKIAEALISRRTVVLDPAPRALLSTALPDRDALPTGRYLVRVILDVGLDAYIGVQRVVEVNRESASQRAALED